MAMHQHLMTDTREVYFEGVGMGAVYKVLWQCIDLRLDRDWLVSLGVLFDFFSLLCGEVVTNGIWPCSCDSKIC